MKRKLEKSFEKIDKKKERVKKPRKAISGVRLGAILGVGLGLLTSLYITIDLHRSFIDSVRMDRLQQLALQRAEFGAVEIEDYLEELWRQINGFARKPTLSASLVLEKQDGIEKIKADLLRQVEGVTAVRFVPYKKAALDPGGAPPISFTQLDMIRSAQLRQVVYPEAVRFGGDDSWVLNVVAPIPQDDHQDVVSVMLVAVTMENLGKKLVQDKASLGRVFLQQEIGNNTAVEIFSVGRGSVGEAVFHPVANSHWKVGFHPSYALLENAKVVSNGVYVAIAFAFLFVTALFLLAGRAVGGYIEGKIKGKTKAGKGDASTANEPGRGAALGDPMYLRADILEVDVSDSDEQLLGLEEATQHSLPDQHGQEEEDILDIEDDPNVPDVIFRAYDIRGLAKDQISNELAQLVGGALGSEALDSGQGTMIVARDARLTSPELTEFLIRGILSSGCNVLNVGTVPTPLLYFATSTLKESQSGVMVTASHNPKEYNGFKVVMNGKSRCDGDIKAIRRRILKNDVYDGKGEESRYDIVPDYIDTIFSDVALAGDVSIVIDAANGVTGVVAPRLFEELGCHVIPLFCDLDGNFPNHSPDPSIEKNLQALVAKVKESKADLGVAFDGDGDRLTVVTSSGEIIWADQLLMLFAKDIVSRNPGADVVFDVKSTRHLASSVTSYGGRPIMWKTGHAPMKNKMLETGALLGGEFSGHIFIKDRWFGFDDGMYAAARLIEILTLQGETLDEMFQEFPKSPATPEIRVPIDEEHKFEVVKKLAEIGNFGEGRVTLIDGVRVDFPFGWGLVRASNTSANLTLRFEADDDESLHKIKSILAKELKVIDSTLQIEWNH